MGNFKKKESNKLVMLSVMVVGILLIVTGLLYSSFALVEPVKSISFQSEKLNYTEKEPGSFKVDKSAKWIDRGKARITFDVESVLKTENKNTDVIFVLDISGSMGGEKLERVKSDSIELINTLLSDSNNQAALISFDSSSEILSDFTNDREHLVNLVNNLSDKGATNYYQALINVDNILKSYTPSKDKDTIVLFLTDGYPCEGVPNEETQYQYLKEQYSYLVINGIQYEMGSEILEPIKKVSDNQYIADINTLNNVLFDASIVPIPYEKFILTDYIDTDNFYVESVSDIKVSEGKVEFNKEEQKITWTIEHLKTGSKSTMTIDIEQKEELIGKGGTYPTNIKEEVNSKIGDIEETVTSIKTPILKDDYQVIYEGNAPTGCTVSNVPGTKSYTVFDQVAIDSSIPVCDGYRFEGWSIVTPYVKRLNSDYFEMPGEDVTIRAEWKSLSLSKSMDGEVYVYIPPVLQKIGTSSYNKDIWQYKDSITKVVFQNEIKSILEAIETFDISEGKNGGVMGYIVPNVDDTSTYTAYIQGDGGVIANKDSSYLFCNFTKLETIEGLEYLDTSNVTNMRSMFDVCKSLTDLNLNHFDTSKVTDMAYMFDCCSGLTNIDVSGLNISNVTTMEYMFYKCSSLPSLSISNFNTSKVTNMGSMFNGCNSLVSLNLSSFNTSKVTNMSAMFLSCSNLIKLDVSHFVTSEVTSMYNMFAGCSSLPSLDMDNFNTSKVTNMSGMFSRCSGLTNLNVSNFDTSNVTDMGNMFSHCSGLMNLDVSHFDTSEVTNMRYIFSNCGGLTNLDLSNFDTSKVTNMDCMFIDCSNLTELDVSSFNTSKVTEMGNMFAACISLTSLDLSNFDTSNVTNMSYMFSGREKWMNLTNLNLASFDTSKVSCMRDMFYNCYKLVELNVSSFNTSNVTDMYGMFYRCNSLISLDISNFDTSNVTEMGYMFYYCRSLTTTITIYNPGASNYNNMFASAATASGTQITVNYIESTSDLVDQMIATKFSSSNVIKGAQVPGYNITINGNDDIVSNINKGYLNQSIILSSVSGNYVVKSFKMNGTLVNGNSFVMPSSDVLVTEIEVVEVSIIESEHNPYPNSLNNKVYGEKSFEGATSLAVTLDYQTESTSYDYIYLYDSSGNSYGKYGGTTRKTETIIIPGNYVKVVFRTDSIGNNYYGFKATVVPNYD